MEKRVRNAIMIIAIIILLCIIFVAPRIINSKRKADLKGQLKNLGNGVVYPEPPEWPTSDDYCQLRNDGSGAYCSGLCNEIPGGIIDRPCMCSIIALPSPGGALLGCECVESTTPCCDSDEDGSISDEERDQFIRDCGGDPSIQAHRDAFGSLGEDCDCNDFRDAAGLNDPTY
jgi:hypothetical protein